MVERQEKPTVRSSSEQAELRQVQENPAGRAV